MIIERQEDVTPAVLKELERAPNARFKGFEAKAKGIRAMLPHVDEFRPIHNLDSIAELCGALSATARRQGDPKQWLKQVA